MKPFYCHPKMAVDGSEVVTIGKYLELLSITVFNFIVAQRIRETYTFKECKCLNRVTEEVSESVSELVREIQDQVIEKLCF